MTLLNPTRVSLESDVLRVAVQKPMHLSYFAAEIIEVVRETDTFVVSERKRMATDDKVNSLLWGRRIETDVEYYVQAEANYDAETAKYVIRFNSSDCYARTPAYELFGIDGARPQIEFYSIQGPRLATCDSFVIEREKATEAQFRELYVVLNKKYGN